MSNFCRLHVQSSTPEKWPTEYSSTSVFLATPEILSTSEFPSTAEFTST
jgi:hypothetical protein